MAAVSYKAAPLLPKNWQQRWRLSGKPRSRTWKHAPDECRLGKFITIAMARLSPNMKNNLKRISVCGFLILAETSLFSGCSHRSSTPQITTTGASVPIGTPPQIGLQSTRAQINAFVAHFVAKGFPSTDLSAQYYPSGRVQTFHYRANYANSKVEASIDAARHTSSISTEEGLSPGKTTTSSSESGIRVY